MTHPQGLPWPPPPRQRERFRWFCYRLAIRCFAPSEWRYRRLRFVGFFVRGRRGWADHDVWGMNNYCAGVMAGMLRRLAKMNHGVPVTFMPGPESDDGCYSDEEMAAGQYAWTHWLLDKSDWLEWFHLDLDGTEGLTNWIDPNLSDGEVRRRIEAHQAKQRHFHEVVMPDLGRHWSCLWD